MMCGGTLASGQTRTPAAREWPLASQGETEPAGHLDLRLPASEQRQCLLLKSQAVCVLLWQLQ